MNVATQIIIIIGNASSGSAPVSSPSLDFSDPANSQYLPIILSMSDDPYEHIPPELMGRHRRKGQMP